MAGIVERQTRQLARFITDLLDASRIERACDIPVAIRAATVGEVFGLARDVAAASIGTRHQTLRIDVGGDDEHAALLCDPERLAQALGNERRVSATPVAAWCRRMAPGQGRGCG